MPKGFLPNTDDGLLSFAQNFVEHVAATPAVYGLAEQDATAYETAFNAYRDALLVAQNASTRTRPTIAAKDTARDALRLLSRQLARKVEATVSVTPEQKRARKLNVRKAPSRTPRPTQRPAAGIDGVFDRTVSMTIGRPGDGARGVLVPGATQVLVYYFAGENYDSDPHTWQFAGVCTGRKFQFTVPASVPAGTRVWACAAYTNKRGEAGPVSMPVSVAVQGTGAQATEASIKIAA
jgi:hypothetical protein